jgi:TPR repeat protein
LLSACAKGVASAAYDLGWHYRKGQGVPKDLGKAMDYFKQAAKKGMMAAQYQLGELYQVGGEGLPKNLTKAIKYYQLAAEQGNFEALANVKNLSAALSRQTPIRHGDNRNILMPPPESKGSKPAKVMHRPDTPSAQEEEKAQKCRVM